MAQIKRLWTDDELIAMPATIDLLRRMRSAAVTLEPSFYLKSSRVLNHMLGGSEELHSPQEALSHAEELANAAADFFAAKLSKTMRKKREYEKWRDLLSDATRQYRLYGAETYARTTLGEVIGNSVIGRLRCIHIDPEYTMKWDLLENNNLGSDSIEKLISDDMGIVSPLSGDYLMARVYASYLRRTKGKSFPSRAAALSKDLSTITLPANADGSLVFSENSAIGIYIDTTETGNTAQALFEHLMEVYPKKTVHEPRFKRTEFVQSEKMQRYWAQAGG